MIITRKEQIIPGLKVRCLYTHISSRFGKRATIDSTVDLAGTFSVVWDDGIDFYTAWTFEPDLFELIEEEPTTKACQNCGCHNKFEVKECWFCKESPF